MSSLLQSRDWLCVDGSQFIRGKYLGSYLSDVLREDPGYLRFLLQEGHVNDDEYDVFRSVLARHGQLNE